MNIRTLCNHLYNRIMSSDIGRRMASGAFWSLLGTGIAKIVVLLSSIICAHILTKEQYGQFGIVRSTINMFVVLGSAGLGVTATKHIAQYLRSEKTKISNIYIVTNSFAFITGTIVTIAILLSAPYIAAHTLNSPELTHPIRVGALLLFVTVINAAQHGTLSGFEDFRSVAVNNFFGSLAESIFMLIGAYFGGVMGAILGYGTGYIILYICNHIAIQKNLKKNNLTLQYHQLKWQDFRILYKFSLPVLISSILVAPTYWIMRTMLVQRSGFEELAIYEAAEQWRMIILFIPTSVSSIVLPILSSLHGTSVKTYKKVFTTNLILNACIAIILSIIISCCSSLIMNAYGEGYGENTLTLIILALTTIFQSTANVIGLSISSQSKVWQGLCFNLFWAIMMITFTYFFLNMNMGASALALSSFLSYIIHTITQLMYISFVLNHSLNN